MKISTNWLKEYVDLKNITDSELAHKLTMTGTNVENYYNIGKNLNKIVIGKILSIEKHKNADKLSVCKIDIKTKILQIITAATNIKINAIVPVCLDGSITANGIKIKKTKFRGEISEGMMCSLEEIGLSKIDFPYADENGIFLIKEPNCKVGQTVCEAFNLNDTIFDFEITSNRPDCLSATGIAREICASFKIPFKLKPPKNYCKNKNESNCFKVEIKSKNCLRYIAKIVKNVKIGTSPDWMKKRLRACGVQPINNIVDITNYVLLEYGIPMHAFNVEKLEDNQIIVRQAHKNEKLETLMNKTAKLDENDLVVCDSKKPLVVAGIIGGIESAIDETTTTVLLEVACFEKTSIRKTAKKISARTESSIRFEKGLNPECCECSMNRACELIEILQAGTVLTPTTDIKNYNNKTKTIELDKNKINKLIGFDLSKTEMIEILNLLDFKLENNQIKIPPHRTDIESCADIAEEIARIYGYEKIEPVAQISESKPKTNLMWNLENELRQICIAFGCDEIYTYSFSNLAEIKKTELNIETELKKAVELANPFGEETRFLKTTTVPSMLASLAFNFKNKQKSAWLFELARTYEFNNQKKPAEPKKLTIGLYGNNADFFTLKGMVEAILKKLKIKKTTFTEIKQMPFHDYCGCKILNGEYVVGKLGEIHPKVCKNFKINLKTFIAILNLDPILKLTKKTIIFKPISKFPESSFDVTVVCDKNLTYSELKNEIKKSIGNILKNCSVFALYEDKSLGENVKSISFNVIMQSQTHTLEKTEIDEAMNRLIKNLEKIGATLRK